MIDRLLKSAVIALPVAVVIACGSETKTDDLAGASPRADATKPIVVAAGAPVVVGISMPLTGPSGTGGLEDSAATLVAVNRWKAKNGSLMHGHEIRVRAEDDGCTETDIAEQAAKRLGMQPLQAAQIDPLRQAKTNETRSTVLKTNNTPPVREVARNKPTATVPVSRARKPI